MSRWLKFVLLSCCLAPMSFACGGGLSPETITGTTGALSIHAEVWADNWFALYVNGKLIKEDSTPITTERSFNAESFIFKADFPLVLGFVVKDFKENDTGLEYIKKNNQKMGDGGFIAQFKNTKTGQTFAVTNEKWKCQVIEEAPLDKACEKEPAPEAGKAPCEFKKSKEPAGWNETGFDDSSWEIATLYTSEQVGPKDGYTKISWNSQAKFIWSSDLKTHNTVLCRLQIQSF